MRLTLTLAGALIIGAYALFGANVMSDWAVSAASGVPLEQAIADMKAANQPYSRIPGYIFAALGLALAATWAWLTVGYRRRWTTSIAIAVWAAIITAGAPAYFFLSFGNLNSVGDTYWDWHPDAAFRWEAPVYLVSALGFVLLITTLAIISLRAIVERRLDGMSR